MKIEVGKTYNTRRYGTVRIIATDASEPQSVIGLHDGAASTWTPAGRFYGAAQESGLDLVSEYVEPPKPREVWVYFIRGDVACSWSAQELEAKRPEDRAELPPLVKFREVIE